jgi:hypothetical protein
MKLTRHVGFESRTNSRIALIMTVLPNTEDCLVVYTDRLPQNLKENFTHTLGSQEAQSAINLADVLSRRLYSDTNKNMLQTLHEYGYLAKLPIDTVEMNPMGSIKIPLRTVLVESGLITRPFPTNEASTKFNPHNFNAQAANVGEALGTARNLLLEADLLENEAKAKREKAYGVAPSLRPGAPAPLENAAPVDLPFLAPPVAAPVEEVATTPLDLAAAYGNGTGEPTL